MIHSAASRDGMAWSVLAWAAVLAGLGVVAGAFGAHALDGRVTPERAETFETAVRYHIYHALALVATGVLMMHARTTALRVAAAAFLAGIVLFSGSLYALVLLDASSLAMITPVGGVLLIAGWGLMAWSAIAQRRAAHENKAPDGGRPTPPRPRTAA